MALQSAPHRRRHERSLAWLCAALALAASGARAQVPAATPVPPAPAVEIPEETPPPLSPELRLKRGKAQFDSGDCAPSVETLAPLAVPGSLGDPRDQTQVHWMLGVCFSLLQKPTESAREFSSLLVLDPDYAIDPLLTPPGAVEVFERQRVQMNAQLDEIRQARDEAKRAQRDAERGVLVERDVTVREIPLASVFIPFGLAQAANGETVWAVVFGATQGVFLAANVGLYWANIAVKADGVTSGDELVAHQVLWFSHLGALGGFVLAYGAGVAEAWWNREDHVVVDRKQSKRALTPEEVKKLRDVKTSPPG